MKIGKKKNKQAKKELQSQGFRNNLPN